MLRHVHEQRAVGLLYGQRALLIGAANPLNFVGSTSTPRAQREPWNRLKDTGIDFETVFFEDQAQADWVFAEVRAMHSRVCGVLKKAAGPYPAGTPYAATMPALMLWTIAVMFDSAMVLYELLVGPLSDAEREALWADYALLAVRFGVPVDAIPKTYREFRRWWIGQLTGGQLFLIDEARATGYETAFLIPMPWPLTVTARPIHNLIMLGSLDETVRGLYELRWTKRHEVLFRVAVRCARAARRTAPRPVARGRNTSAFEMVARAGTRRSQRRQPSKRRASKPPASADR